MWCRHLYHLACVPKSPNFIAHLSNWATIIGVPLGVFVFLLAGVEYLNRKKDKELGKQGEILQGINSIKSQLLTMRGWTGTHPNYSIPKEIDKKEFEKNWYENNYTRAMPFMQVFEIESTALHAITTLPAVKYFSDGILEEIAELNQALTSFNSFLSEIRAFKFSRDAYKNLILTKKLKETKGLTSYLDVLDDEERLFAEQLLRYQFVLHFQLIGDDNKNISGVYYWHEKLLKSLTDLEDKTKQEIIKIEKRNKLYYLKFKKVERI